MTTPVLLLTALTASTFGAYAAYGTVSENAAPSGTDTSSAIVVLREGTDPEVFAREHGLVPDHVYRRLLNGFSATVPAAPAFHALRSRMITDPRLLRIEPDRPVSLPDHLEPGVPRGIPPGVSGAGQSNPPWGLDRIDQRTLPLDHSYRTRVSGKGVTVFVVDTGIRYDHSEFEGRAAPGFDAYRGEQVQDAYRGALPPGSDCNGHGTHVAGIIGGRTSGVARSAQLRSVRVLGCDGIGSTSALLAGLEWIASNHRAGPSVVNYSIVGTASAALDEAVTRLIDSGVVMVAAAGNNGGDACQLSPGRVPGLITVGASDPGDRRWASSNWGSCVSWFAPGSRILSASHTGSDKYLEMSGTSMASPHVAGVAALELERNPDATQSALKNTLLRRATRGVIADPRGGVNALLYSGED